MSEDNGKKTSLVDWLNTIPGILTAMAVLLGAIGTFIVVLNQNGCLKLQSNSNNPSNISPSPTPSILPIKSPHISNLLPSTPVSLVSVTGVGSNGFYFFAQGKDNLIYYANGQLGGKRSDLQKVDGQVSADSAPSAGAVDSQIFVAVKGSNNHLYMNQATSGSAFNNSWQDMNFQTDSAPAVVGVQNFVYIFAKSIDGTIHFNRAALGSDFEGWKVVEGDGVAAPGSSPAAGATGNYMYVLIRSTDNSLLINQGTTNGSFQPHWLNTNLTSYASPAATGVGKYVYFFVVGTDGQVSYDYVEVGGGGHGWKMVADDNPPAAAVAAGAVGNSYLFITIKGKDGKLYVNQGDVLSNFNKWSPF